MFLRLTSAFGEYSPGTATGSLYNLLVPSPSWW